MFDKLRSIYADGCEADKLEIQSEMFNLPIAETQAKALEVLAFIEARKLEMSEMKPSLRESDSQLITRFSSKLGERFEFFTDKIDENQKLVGIGRLSFEECGSQFRTYLTLKVLKQGAPTLMDSSANSASATLIDQLTRENDLLRLNNQQQSLSARGNGQYIADNESYYSTDDGLQFQDGGEQFQNSVFFTNNGPSQFTQNYRPSNHSVDRHNRTSRFERERDRNLDFAQPDLRQLSPRGSQQIAPQSQRLSQNQIQQMQQLPHQLYRNQQHVQNQPYRQDQQNPAQTGRLHQPFALPPRDTNTAGGTPRDTIVSPRAPFYPSRTRDTPRQYRESGARARFVGETLPHYQYVQQFNDMSEGDQLYLEQSLGDRDQM